MNPKERLMNRALAYIYNDKALPVDLAVELGEAGINVDALEERHHVDAVTSYGELITNLQTSA